jgi:ribokinase
MGVYCWQKKTSYVFTFAQARVFSHFVFPLPALVSSILKESIMRNDSIYAVVAGGLGTDVFGLGLNRLVGQGELEFGGKLHIGAGGKSRNMAEMMSRLLGSNKVAMVGRTSKDPLNLWSVPVDALRGAGVNVDYVKILPFEIAGKFPQVALIAVDVHGNNQIYVIPGVNEDFCADDVAEALPAFQSARANGGVLALSLELPLNTAVAAVKQANSLQLRVALDPGGIRQQLNYDELLSQDIYLLKPNEHEASILSGRKVVDAKSAREAAQRLLKTGVKNVLITMGAKGAYLANKDRVVFIDAPEPKYGNGKDETGCGDQTMAAVCATLLAGCDLLTAANAGIVAGTMQFCRSGIVPVTRQELDKALSELPR